MPVIHDTASINGRRGTSYPAQYARGLEGRIKRALTEALGLTQFGVNVTTLEPGAMSAQRHWHTSEDEFIYVLSGEITLIDNGGEQVLGPGAVAGFPAREPNGHHLVNRGPVAATYLEVGTRASEDDCTYPDIDMVAEKRGGRHRFFKKNGEPYP